LQFGTGLEDQVVGSGEGHSFFLKVKGIKWVRRRNNDGRNSAQIWNWFPS
jgi:hypothetical protein